jgi:hypothetical protein
MLHAAMRTSSCCASKAHAHGACDSMLWPVEVRKLWQHAGTGGTRPRRLDCAGSLCHGGLVGVLALARRLAVVPPEAINRHVTKSVNGVPQPAAWVGGCIYSSPAADLLCPAHVGTPGHRQEATEQVGVDVVDHAFRWLACADSFAAAGGGYGCNYG